MGRSTRQHKVLREVRSAADHKAQRSVLKGGTGVPAAHRAAKGCRGPLWLPPFTWRQSRPWALHPLRPAPHPPPPGPPRASDGQQTKRARRERGQRSRLAGIDITIWLNLVQRWLQLWRGWVPRRLLPWLLLLLLLVLRLPLALLVLCHLRVQARECRGMGCRVQRGGRVVVGGGGGQQVGRAGHWWAASEPTITHSGWSTNASSQMHDTWTVPLGCASRRRRMPLRAMAGPLLPPLNCTRACLALARLHAGNFQAKQGTTKPTLDTRRRISRM